ncbi:MAG: transporter [Gemmatimonadales bacterium]
MRRVNQIALLLLAACAPLHPSTGPVVADRPGYTDAPTSMPAGVLAVEVGVTDDRVSGVTYRSFGELLVRVGVGGGTELRFFGNSYGVRSGDGAERTEGLEDIKLGAKIALHTAPDSVHGATPRLALLLASTIPTGADNRSAGVALPEAKLAAAWTTSGPFSLFSNLGAGATYDGSSWGSHGWGSLALWFAVNSKVSLFGEGITTARIGGSATSSSYLDGGVTFLLGPRLQLDFRAGHGVGTNASHEHFFGAGLAMRW